MGKAEIKFEVKHEIKVEAMMAMMAMMAAMMAMMGTTLWGYGAMASHCSQAKDKVNGVWARVYIYMRIKGEV